MKGISCSMHILPNLMFEGTVIKMKKSPVFLKVEFISGEWRLFRLLPISNFKLGQMCIPQL